MATDNTGITWTLGPLAHANELLARHHYLGPLKSGGAFIVIGYRDDTPVAAQVWKHPTARNLPSDGSWLELARWCLTPEAGRDAGSRMHKHARSLLRENAPSVTTLVSYSDPSQGHTGALYRACNWQWRPTWHRLRPPPSGQGNWGSGRQEVKDRWVFPISRDPASEEVTHIKDAGAIRYWQANGTEIERRWAKGHPQLDPTL